MAFLLQAFTYKVVSIEWIGTKPAFVYIENLQEGEIAPFWVGEKLWGHGEIKKITSESIVVTDDFGNTLEVKVGGFILPPMEKELGSEGGINVGKVLYHQAKYLQKQFEEMNKGSTSNEATPPIETEIAPTTAGSQEQIHSTPTPPTPPASPNSVSQKPKSHPVNKSPAPKTTTSLSNTSKPPATNPKSSTSTSPSAQLNPAITTSSKKISTPPQTGTYTSKPEANPETTPAPAVGGSTPKFRTKAKVSPISSEEK